MTKGKRQQLAVLLIFGMVFLTFIFALHGSLLSRIIGTFGLDDSLKGIPSASCSAGGFLALLSAFVFQGRIGKVTLLKWGVLICSVFLLLVSMTSVFGLFVACWGVIGIGLGYLDTLLSSCMADLYQGETLRRMMCILHFTYGMAFVIAPVVYSYALQYLDEKLVAWNRLYLFVAGMGIFLLVLLLAATRKNADVKMDSAAKEEKLSGKLLKNLMLADRGALLKWIAAMLFHGIFLSSMSTWINRYAEQLLQRETGIYALSFLFLGVMLSRLLMSFVKIPTGPYLCVSGILAFGMTVWMLGCESEIPLYITLCVCGLFFGALIPCMLTVSTSSAPHHSMLVTTLMMLSLYLGEVIGPAFTGMLETVYHLGIGIGVSGISIAMTSLCCVAAGSWKQK